MRTTVAIDDHLLAQARAVAARRGVTLGQVVDDALRLLLVERPAPRQRSTLPVFGGSGLQPGVDLEDKESLSALLDRDGTEPRAAG